MQNLILSLNIVLPLFLLMVLGYFLKTVGMLDKVTLKKMNSLIFKAFLPCLIFYNVYTSEISDIFDKKLVFFSVGCVVASFLVLMAVIPFIEKDNKKRGVIIQGIFRSNFVIFGIPLSVALYGDGIVGSAAVLIAIVVPVYNFLAVLTLEIFRGGKPNLGKIAKGIVTNPLIIASLAGLAAMFGGLKLPGAIEDTIGDVSKITTPLALIVLGGSMDFKKNRQQCQAACHIGGGQTCADTACVFAPGNTYGLPRCGAGNFAVDICFAYGCVLFLHGSADGRRRRAGRSDSGVQHQSVRCYGVFVDICLKANGCNVSNT